ncbi:MAG TPA: hypothetical protein VD713_04485, partial [Sphingomonadales bacterium]|nr:hypothetical protein [Sphingomonadales bacterium]
PVALQAQETLSGRALYDSIKKFELTGGTAKVNNLAVKRDRVEMTFTGTFYFAAPVNGRVFGAVFLGQGTFRAEAPPSNFEKDNLRRLLKADVLEADFGTAVLRFSDDTFHLIGQGAGGGEAMPEATKLAAEFEPRLRKETGANLSARLAVSVLNGEQPGFFAAEFDQGRRGRFAFLMDQQGRTPVSAFAINGGEKGLVFAYRRDFLGIDVWMAFYSLADYQRRRAQYSDAFDLIGVERYAMEADVREPKKAVKLRARLNLVAIANGIRAVPFDVNDGLSVRDDQRLKKAMRLKGARFVQGAEIEAVQEDWETGLTVFLPASLNRGEKSFIEISLEGDFLYDVQAFPNGHYPLSNTSWYPRHGYLNRSAFDITFYHHKRQRIASMGARVREEADPEDKDGMIT